MEELWKSSTKYPRQLISSFGNIKGARGLRKVTTNNSGYRVVDIQGKTFMVHRLVAELFIANPDSLPQVNHKDGNKLNNNALNLEWCTGQENIQHRDTHKLLDIAGSNNPATHLTEEDVTFIRSNYKPRDAKYGRKALAKRFHIHETTIYKIITGINW